MSRAAPAPGLTRYFVRTGERFRTDDGAILEGGSVIDLSPDVAAVHAHRIRLPLDGEIPEDPASP